MNHLQTCLASLSEDQLRNMVSRVAAKDPYFCDVFAMELDEALDLSTSDIEYAPQSITSSRTRPEKHCHKQARRGNRPRTLSNTRVHFPPTQTDPADSDWEGYAYHPGQIQSEDYEFLTVTQDGRAYRTVQTVSMWSCCEGDDTSIGCKLTPAVLRPAGAQSKTKRWPQVKRHRA